ncbi:MAG: CDP-alcohol phosphatidyltransferase family protein [Terriglobia bacterium]
MVRKAVLINLTLAPVGAPPRLAGLPLPVRAVLSAQRAGIEEIIIVGGDDPGRLLDPGLKVAWRWLPLPAQSQNELNALRRVREELKEDFVLFFADSVFDATALASLRAARLEGKAARIAALPVSDDGLTGASLYVASPEFLRRLPASRTGSGGDEAGDGLDRIDSFAAHLREQGQVDRVKVSGTLWPRTTDGARLRAIERALAHLNLKPSDGIFAKFNKMVVAEPLIRFFLRTPATPNFITGLGLFLGLGSGWAFAQGSYGWGIAGAFLAYVSAIMDHCDGMVARLKFQESEFGVWFETAVDYVSYLAIFVGLAIGLYRETGFVHHLFVGGLFLFGWVMSFILQSRQRNLASGDNPADFPNRIHTKLEQHSRNFFHWFSRRLYFLVRRAVLPYFILLFCLLDLRVLLLGWVTFGANLVWLLTLYNNRLFRPAKTTATAEAD